LQSEDEFLKGIGRRVLVGHACFSAVAGG